MKNPLPTSVNRRYMALQPCARNQSLPQRFCLSSADLENPVETGEFEHFFRRILQPEEHKQALSGSGTLQALDERGDPGAVEVTDLTQVDRDLRNPLVVDGLQYRRPHLGR